MSSWKSAVWDDPSDYSGAQAELEVGYEMLTNPPLPRAFGSRGPMCALLHQALTSDTPVSCDGQARLLRCRSVSRRLSQSLGSDLRHGTGSARRPGSIARNVCGTFSRRASEATRTFACALGWSDLRGAPTSVTRSAATLNHARFSRRASGQTASVRFFATELTESPAEEGWGARSALANQAALLLTGVRV